MQHQFHLKLFRAQFSVAKGVVFVYEFHGDDGFAGVLGFGFADAYECVRKLASF